MYNNLIGQLYHMMGLFLLLWIIITRVFELKNDIFNFLPVAVIHKTKFTSKFNYWSFLGQEGERKCAQEKIFT